MNRIYRIVFNRTLCIPQVVSELATSSGGATIGQVDALPRTELKARALVIALGLALSTFVLPALAQTCTPTTGTLAASCAGTTASNGGTGANGAGATPSAAGSGAGGSSGGAGAGGAFGGAGGAPYPFGTGAGGGGGVYGGGGESGGYFSEAAVAGGGGGTPALVATGSLTVNTGVTVTGGSGGVGASNGNVGYAQFGSNGTPTSFGAGGGGGGAGVSFGVGSASLTNAGTIAGGNGGNGGGGYIPGAGGGGGMGLSVSGAGNTIGNSGLITGGNGGAGGATSASGTNGFVQYAVANGGAGGAGLSVSGSGNTIINSGVITGGAGGAGTDHAGAGGVGVGISGSNNLLITSGLIAGGLDGAGANPSDAVEITGSDNTLELLSGYSFNGNVVSTPGNGNVLSLGGSTSASFGVAAIGAQFTGFDSYLKSGSSTWTLTGTIALVTPWTISAGVLSISSDSALGATTGTVTLNGGTLQTTDASHTLLHNIVVDSGAISASGNLTFNDQVNGANNSLALNSQGVITESGSATIQLGMLTGSSTGSTTLTSASNQIATLGNFTATNFTLATSGNLTLAGNITTTGGSTGLSIEGNLTQSSGAITAGTLTVSATNAVLNDAANNVSILANAIVSESGNFSFVDSSALRITGTVLGGAAAFTDTGGAIVDTGTVTTSGASGTTIGAGTIFQVGNGVAAGSILGNVTNNDELVFQQPSATTVGGVISGSGSLYQESGGSILYLTGADNYTGSTVIQSGTLLVGNGGVAGSISSSPTVMDNGTFGFDLSSSIAYAGVISGSGAFELLGSGTVTLTGTDTYTGGTSIGYGGTLQLGSGGTTGSIGGNVTDNGTLAFDHSSALTFAGVIGGMGGLKQIGTGATTLSGANTYTGATTISGGTLALSGSGSIADSSDVADNGTFSISGTNSGASIMSLSGSGSVTLGNKTLTLSNAANTFSGAMTGSGGLALNAGSETLTGNNTYSGATTINGGTLSVSSGGTVASSSVVDNGMLLADGAGTSVTATMASLTTPFMVGDNGTGALTASHGAAIASANEFNIGQNAGDTGTVAIASDATLSTTGSINVGKYGTGTLSVSGGGSVVDNGFLSIADQAGAHGTITVSDSGSSITEADEIAVGNHDGTGTLTIANGGMVSAPLVVIAADPDAAGTLNIGAAAGSAAVASGTLDTASVAFGNGSGSLVFNLTDAGYVFAPSISGNGAVEVLAGTTIFTADNSYTGSTTIGGGSLQLGNGGASGSIATDVSDNGVLAFNRSDDTTFAGAISGGGSVAQLGPDNLTLSNTNTYGGGTTIAAGTLTGTTGSFGSGAVTDNAAMVLSQSTDGTFANAISGSGSLAVNGAAAITLSGTNSYSGGTTVNGGTLIGDSNSLQGAIVDNAALNFNQGFDGSFAGALSGAGTLGKTGAGALSLSADSSAFTGATSVSGGTLLVDGALGGNVDVTATVGGQGTLSGNVTIENGGVLAPGDQGGSIGTLNVGGDLLMQQGSAYSMDVGTPGAPLGLAGSSDSVSVAGNLTLNGVTLNINDAGGMGPGIYRIFDYAGTLSESNGGITLGTIPAGDTLSIQTLTADKQINLVDSTGLTLSFWNANGQASSTQAGGGSGTWSVTSQTWTDANGDITAPMGPQPGLAIFSGAPGTVTVDNSAGAVSATGLQFASGGYLMTGDTLTLVDNAGAAPIIRVGDGSSNGASYSAEIDNVLAGTAGLAKADYGTLILAGNNTYTGGTTISGGTLQIGNGGTTGSIVGDIANSGALMFDRSDSTSFTGIISGSGSVAQIGGGTLTLTAANTFTGATTISNGTLALSGAGSIASSSGVSDSGTFDISNASNGASINRLSGNGSVQLGAQTLTLTSAADTFSGVIAGNGGLTIAGGTEILTGSNTYAGATTISSGTLALGSGGSIGNSSSVSDSGTLDISSTSNGASINSLSGHGNVVLGTQTLTLTNSADTFSGVIAGSGGLAIASGTEILAGSNTYTGGTTISGGTLALSGGGSIASSAAVNDNGTFDISATNSGASVSSLSGNGTVALGARTLTLTNAADTFSGGIAGSGGLVIASGTEILAGSNTYTGGTTISAGMLQVGDGGAAGSIAGNVLDSGKLVFDRSDVVNFGGSISGKGSVAQSGAGTTVFMGANTYTGGTTINKGTLQVGNGGTAGSIAGNVANNGTLAFDRSDNVVFGGLVSGSGSVMQAGSGSLTLTAANSYSGGTELNGGALDVGSNAVIGSGTLAMAAGTTLNLDASFTLANTITLSGDPTINTGAGQTDTLSGGISEGTQAGDLVKTGTGTLVLTGMDTYTGATNVAGGTLDVEGHLASTVSVANGATLIGNGSMGGLEVASGATIAPGNNSVGTLTVNGNVTMASGSQYQVNATDTGSSDLIKATGTAMLGGGSVVTIAAGNNWKPYTHYTILTTGGGVSGGFGAVSSNFAFLTPTLSYDSNNAYLTLMRNTTGFPVVGVTPNQIHTAAGVEALAFGNNVFDAILPMAVAPARNAFTELSGDNLASTRTAIVDDSRFVRDAINSHLQGVQGSGDVSQSDNDGSIWTSAWGHGGDHDSDGNAARMSDTGSGLLVGADRNLDAWRLGAVAGTGELSNNSTYGAADAHSTDTVFGLYTGYNVDAWQFQGGVAHSWYQTHSHRQIDLAGVSGTDDASYANGVTQAYADGGYQFTFSQSSLTPYVDLARVWMHQASINEVGGPSALDVQANGTSVNYGTLGWRGMFSPTPGLQLHANVGYQHAWGDLESIDTQSFASGGTDSFSVAGLPVSRNAGLVDFGMRFALGKNVSVDASYHGQFARDMKDEGARMSLNVQF
ncbi:autotransporter-associated beta strand repeat-containing protein [Dyella jejuensis]|uniref:Autotransporter-associated beta strand repeat-containing protein n=1 Tax=Dyella jejuensis TaxID=1432009 RepID=A0ABW8JJQ5_9GAMM